MHGVRLVWVCSKESEWIENQNIILELFSWHIVGFDAGINYPFLKKMYYLILCDVYNTNEK